MFVFGISLLSTPQTLWCPRRFHRPMSSSPWFPGPRCLLWRRRRRDHRRRASPSAWHDTWHRCTWWWDISMQGEPWTTACNLELGGLVFWCFFLIQRRCWTCCGRCRWKDRFLTCELLGLCCWFDVYVVFAILYGWVWLRTQRNPQVLLIEGL